VSERAGAAPLPLPERVVIREVGPRDGLQAEAPLPPAARARLIEAVSATGVPKVEAVSFVSPRAVPAMADAAEVWRLVTRTEGVAYSALVPNRRGAEAAMEAGGFASIQAFVGASDGYNTRNVGKTAEESMADVDDVLEVGRGAGVPVEVSLSAAFGDPYDGDVAPERVVSAVGRLMEGGAAGISLGDTTGMATPTRVWEVVGLLHETFGAELPLNLHFHDTRGTGLANVLAALQAGVTDFDASVGGLGGSPYAPPGANGNVATEDLVHMLADMGVATGVDLDRVIDASKLAESLLGRPLRGQVTRVGPRWRVAEGDGGVPGHVGRPS
jgi:hydroxymethylglutaryl-CoA lyase